MSHDQDAADHWPELLAEEAARFDAAPASRVLLTQHDGPAGSGGSEAQHLHSEEGDHFAVKFRNNQQGLRVLFNDQIIGRLATMLGAPCPTVEVVDVHPDIAGQIRLSTGPADFGTAHGSRWLEQVAQAPTYETADVNRERFTQLAVLFTVIRNTDSQYIYATATPHVVYSVDHGHGLTGSPNWSAADLDVSAPPTSLVTVPQATHSTASLRTCLTAVESVQDQALARALAEIPDGWNVTIEERLAVARFVRRQIGAVVSVLERMIEENADGS